MQWAQPHEWCPEKERYLCTQTHRHTAPRDDSGSGWRDPSVSQGPPGTASKPKSLAGGKDPSRSHAHPSMLVGFRERNLCCFKHPVCGPLSALGNNCKHQRTFQSFTSPRSTACQKQEACILPLSATAPVSLAHVERNVLPACPVWRCHAWPCQDDERLPCGRLFVCCPWISSAREPLAS